MASAGKTFHRRERGPRARAAHGLSLYLLAVGPAAAAAPPVTLTAVRFWSLPEVTRIALETSRDVQFRHDRLHNPDRLYFDLLDTGSALSRRGAKEYPVGDGLVKQIRVAQTRRTVARVVIDLAGPAEFATSQLANPARLVIEVRSPAPAGGKPPPPGVSRDHRPSPGSAGAPATVEPPKATARLRAGRPPQAGNSDALPAQPPSEAKPAVERRNPRAGPVPAPAMGEPPAEAALRIPAVGDTARTAPVTPEAAKPAKPPSGEPAAQRPEPAREQLPAEIASRGTTPGDPASPKPDTASRAQSPAVPAKSNSLAGRSLTRALGLKLGRIVLDPGHGGHDHGTTGPKGLMEKDLVLDIARRLGALIEQEMGSEVIFTRTSDTFVSLEARTRIANDAKADLFLSIHANSSRMVSIAGVETFYLDFTTSKADLDVAARENASSEKKIFELEELVKKITLTEKVKESREFAARVQTALHGGLARGNSRVRDRGVKKAPFIVLIGASMPSVLTEIGFVSNPREEALFSRPEYRQKVAESLLKGIAQYAATLSHFQVARSSRK